MAKSSTEKMDALKDIMQDHSIINPIKRDELADLLYGPCHYDKDRAARDLISEARSQFPIVNNGRGYFVARTIEEANPWIKEQTSKALRILKGAAEVKSYFRIKDDQQITVDDYIDIVKSGCIATNENKNISFRSDKKLGELRNYCMVNGISLMEVGKACKFGKYTTDSDYENVLSLLKSLVQKQEVVSL